MSVTVENIEMSALLEVTENPTEKLLQQFIKCKLQKELEDSGPTRSHTFPLTNQQKNVPCRFKSDGDSPNKESLSPVISELTEENCNVLITDEQKEHELPTLVEEDGLNEDKKEDETTDVNNIGDKTPTQIEELKIETPNDSEVTKKKGLWSRFKSNITRSFRYRKTKSPQKGSHSVETLPSEQVKPVEVETVDSAPESDREDPEQKKPKKKPSKVTALIRRLSLRKASKKSSDSEVSSPDTEHPTKNFTELDGKFAQRPTSLPQALFNISNLYNKKNESYKTSSRLKSETSPNELDAEDEDAQILSVAEELFKMANLHSPDTEKSDEELKSVEQELADYLRKCGDQFNEDNKVMLRTMFTKVVESDQSGSQVTEKIARLFLFSTETAFLIMNVSQHLSSLLLKSTVEFAEDKFAYLLTGKEGWGTVMNEASDSDCH